MCYLCSIQKIFMQTRYQRSFATTLQTAGPILESPEVILEITLILWSPDINFLGVLIRIYT